MRKSIGARKKMAFADCDVIRSWFPCVIPRTRDSAKARGRFRCPRFGVEMRTLGCLYAGLLGMLVAIAANANESDEVDSVIKEAAPVIAAFEAVVQGKAHPPLDSFIEPSASLDGVMPLRAAIAEAVAQPGPLPKDSHARWVSLKSVALAGLKEIIPENFFPKGVDRDKIILIFYETRRKPEGDVFRESFWIGPVEEKWMVLFGTGGWDRPEPLQSLSRPVPVSLLTDGLALIRERNEDEESNLIVEAAPVIAALEAAVQGKAHPPLETFIEPSASVDGEMPLREAVAEAVAQPGPLPKDSHARWVSLNSVALARLEEIIPENFFPKGVDRDKIILVFRETSRKPEGDVFRASFWLGPVEEKWMVLFGTGGWDRPEPLQSLSQPVPPSLLDQKE